MKKLFAWILAFVLLFSFIGCVGMLSSDEEPTDNLSETPVTGADSYDEATPDPTQEPTPEPTKAPTPKPTSEPTKAPTPKPTANEPLVWIPTNGGKKYHSNSGCSGMKDPIQVTKSKAVSQGFSPCGRCY